MSAICFNKVYNHTTSRKRESINCFIEKTRDMLLDLADFNLQERQEVTILCPLFLGHCILAKYSMTAKQNAGMA